MQVILLERVEKLGQMGDEVRSRTASPATSCCRKKKALRATKANREYFADPERAQLEARNLERKAEAEAIAKKLEARPSSCSARPATAASFTARSAPRDIADVDRRRRLHDRPHAGAARQGDQDDRPVPDCRWCCIPKCA